MVVGGVVVVVDVVVLVVVLVDVVVGGSVVVLVVVLCSIVGGHGRARDGDGRASGQSQHASRDQEPRAFYLHDCSNATETCPLNQVTSHSISATVR